MTRRQWGLITLAGLMLGTHFLFFFYALEYAPVLTALAFGNMTPLFTAFIGWAVLSETVNRKVLLGAVLALVGIVVVGWRSPRVTRRHGPRRCWGIRWRRERR